MLLHIEYLNEQTTSIYNNVPREHTGYDLPCDKWAKFTPEEITNFTDKLRKQHAADVFGGEVPEGVRQSFFISGEENFYAGDVATLHNIVLNAVKLVEVCPGIEPTILLYFAKRYEMPIKTRLLTDFELTQFENRYVGRFWSDTKTPKAVRELLLTFSAKLEKLEIGKGRERTIDELKRDLKFYCAKTAQNAFFFKEFRGIYE